MTNEKTNEKAKNELMEEHEGFYDEFQDDDGRCVVMNRFNPTINITMPNIEVSPTITVNASVDEDRSKSSRTNRDMYNNPNLSDVLGFLDGITKLF